MGSVGACCSWCWEPLEGEPRHIVAYGETHQLHEQCEREWMRLSSHYLGRPIGRPAGVQLTKLVAVK